MQAFHVRHSHPVPRWNTHTMHRQERGELSCKERNPTMPRSSPFTKTLFSARQTNFSWELEKEKKNHAKTTQAYTDKQGRFHHVKSRLSRTLSARHPFHANSCKDETIRRVIMDKQSRSFLKLHREENLTCKRDKHAKLQKGMKPFPCMAYNRGENTMVHHQGKIYFISGEKSKSWLQYTTSKITRR